MKTTTTKVVKPASLDRERIGQQIRSIREQQKIDAKTLAQMADIDSGNLCRIEQGKYSVGLDVLSKIVHPLGYRVDIVPIVDNEKAVSTASKKKRRYNNIDVELLKPEDNFDYAGYWVTSNLLGMMGVPVEGLKHEELSELERAMTFSRSVIFGNSRCVFNYGRLMGLYIMPQFTREKPISKENSDIIYSVANFVCNMITDSFAKEVSNSDFKDIERYVKETYDYFYELTAKWMYMNNFTKENENYALLAAQWTINARFAMMSVENMLEEIFPFLVFPENKYPLEYNIYI